MKIGQSIEYNMKNIFPYTKKDGGESIPRPFSKKSKLTISLDQYSKVLYRFFLLKETLLKSHFGMGVLL